MPIGNNSIFGAFTLGEVRSGRLSGDWLNPDMIANYGWFGGGANYPAQFSTIDRIDFSNDSVTASPRTPLTSARYGVAATGNSNYGWFGGGTVGLTPTNVSAVQRTDFSNDLGVLSIRSPLSEAKWALEATGNSNYGWFGGGVSVPTAVSRVERIDFSNDFLGYSIRGPLTSVRSKFASTSNLNYGWFGGPIVDRIDFSNDFSTALLRGSLTPNMNFSRSTGNSNYGWFGGGDSPFPTPDLSTVNRINFANDLTTASVRGPLSGIRYGMGATGNSNYGWFGGGSFPSKVSSVDRIDFSNDSATASVRGSLTSARYNIGATSGVLNIRRQKAGNFGWFGGGYVNVTPRSIVDRIDFSNDSATASVRGPLASARYWLTATGNANYGWFGGGLALAPSFLYYSRVDRIDFSNDSATASIRGPLNTSKNRLAATGNSNYGWFGSGYTTNTNELSSIDRIDFSNDSATASVRGPLISARNSLAATGNSNYGWFGGRFPAGRVDRIDFSNDLPTASVRGELSSARSDLAATANSNYGWFGGGAPAPSSSVVDRIDFSNDSATASVRGPLSAGRGYLAATGNSNYGWFSGNLGTSRVDRIDFSNDSATSSPRGVLSLTRDLRGSPAVSNISIG